MLQPRTGASRGVMGSGGPGPAALLALITIACYLPALHGGFIWDDDRFLTANPLIQASDGLRRFWCTTEAPDYWPVTSSTLWFEWRLWGLHAAGYHATNLCLHVAEVLLLWRLLRRLGARGAFLASALFAVHPVNAESVVWITQRKNLMAMLFCLLSVLAFLKYADTESGASGPGRRSRSTVPWSYPWSLGAFVLAMLSKGSAAFLPFVLLGIVAWRGRVGLRNAAHLAPFFATAAVFAAINLWFQSIHYAPLPVAPVVRLLSAAKALWFYLGKAVLPLRLLFIYPQWHVRSDDLRDWMPLACAVAVTLLLWSNRRGWARTWLFAWGYFIAALVPVLGLAQTAFMVHAPVSDHYEHFALIGVCAMAGHAGGLLWMRRGSAIGWSAVTGAAAVVGALACLTWRQSVIYGDARILFERTLEGNPDSWMARNNLGNILSDAGDRIGAMKQYEEALRLRPSFAEAHFNYGNSLFAQGRVDEACRQYAEASRLSPANPLFHARAQTDVADGGDLLRRGNAEGAIFHFRAAVQLAPSDSADAECDLGIALAYEHRLAESIAHFEAALRQEPAHAPALNNLGNVLIVLGRPREAAEHLSRAVALRPGDYMARFNLGVALRQLGEIPEAKLQFSEALRLNPDFHPALEALGGP